MRTGLSPREEEQCKKLLAHWRFKDGSRSSRILRYLVREAFQPKPRFVDTNDIWRDVFQSKTSASNVQKGLSDLRFKLEDYYGSEGEGADEEIEIRITSRPYGIECKLRAPSEMDRRSPKVNAGGEAAEIQSRIKEQLPTVDCFHVGDNKAGLKYEMKMMPLLRRVRDTHVRSKEGHRTYEEEQPELLEAFQEKLQEFLGRRRTNRLQLIAGPVVEEKYLNSIAEAAKGHEDRVENYKVSSGTWLNFAILDYLDRNQPSEVLFGWGRYDDKPDEAVFLSSDPKLVREFANLYSSLIESADRVTDVKDLLNDTRGTAQITEWSHDRVYKLLRSAKPGMEVRMLTTLFVDWGAILPIVRELCQRGVQVKIVMMDPGSKELVKARFERRADRPPLIALRDLSNQLEHFEALCDERGFVGSLEVRISSVMPFGYFVQCGNVIVMGLLPPLSAYHECPMIEVKAHELLGKQLEKNWHGYWSRRSSAELEKLERDKEIEEIWLAIPSFSKDAKQRARFKRRVRDNAKRGVKYVVIFPDSLSPEMEREWREFSGLFRLPRPQKKRNGLKVIPVDDQQFRRLMPNEAAARVVILNPYKRSEKSGNLYVEIPAEQLWQRVDGDEATTTLNRFTQLVKQHS